MTYWVKFLRGDAEVASVPMGGPQQKAEHFASAQLPIKAKLLGATSVQVIEVASRAVVFKISN
jgi:hypothetical protein